MTNRDNHGASFQVFLQGWLVRQQHYLEELISVLQHSHESRDEDLKELINRVLAHYQQYYEEKSKVAHSNVFLVFSAKWFTTLERAFFWIAGFKPGLAFRLVTDSVNDLSEEQRQRMNRLLNETKAEERALNDELAKIQESVAAPPMLDAMKRRGQSVDGEEQRDETAMEALKTAMETILTAADSLRITTALKVVEILSPTQNLKFLAAATQLQLKIRGCGVERS